MQWKKIGIWRTTYVWMTYILPYLRYGSLIFRENVDNDGNPQITTSMIRFCKIYNGTVKRMYGLTRGTPNVLIDEILGSWKPQTAIM